MKKLVSFLATVLFLTTTVQGSQFTYLYDHWGIPTPSPDAYTVTAFIVGEDFGIGHFVNPRGLFVRDNTMFVADTGNHRIVHLGINDDATHYLVNVIESISINGVTNTFSYPHDVFQSVWGDIFIADTNNQRIIHVDENWNFINQIYQPEGNIEGFGDTFLPENLVVDRAGRLFVQARHINRGLVEFDNQGNFTGFMGANLVEITPWDQFWRMIATQEQRARMALTVPTEYSNVDIDHEGFIWVTNATPQGDALRRLNSMGNDVMIRNGNHDIEGDLWFADAGNLSGPSRFIDSTMLPNGTVAVFDQTRGRIFNYDFQGNLLYVFGGPGNREGNFIMPVALESSGYTLFALDAQVAAITRFDLTNYGYMINSALTYYRRGLYDESAAAWQEVMRMNGNFGPAYIGIARAYLRLGYYQQAMRYFRMQNDARNYGRAFGFFRQQWVEQHFWIFSSIVGILIFLPPVIRFIFKIRKEIMEA